MKPVWYRYPPPEATKTETQEKASVSPSNNTNKKEKEKQTKKKAKVIAKLFTLHADAITKMDTTFCFLNQFLSPCNDDKSSTLSLSLKQVVHQYQ